MKFNHSRKGGPPSRGAASGPLFLLLLSCCATTSATDLSASGAATQSSEPQPETTTEVPLEVKAQTSPIQVKLVVDGGSVQGIRQPIRIDKKLLPNPEVIRVTAELSGVPVALPVKHEGGDLWQIHFAPNVIQLLASDSKAAYSGKIVIEETVTKDQGADTLGQRKEVPLAITIQKTRVPESRVPASGKKVPGRKPQRERPRSAG